MIQEAREDAIETIQLANGTVEARSLVVVTMLSLKDLLASHPIAFYELVMKCRDREHSFFGNAREILEQQALVQQDGGVHGSIRNIVLSAAKGDGLEMTLGSPLPAPNQDQK